MSSRVLLTASVLLAAIPAFADRYYVAADLGVASFDDSVSSSAVLSGTFGDTPPEIPLRGQQFKSTETAWGISGGWQYRDWLAFEVGFTDLGNSGQKEFSAFFGPLIIPNDPMFLPGPLVPPSGFGGFVSAAPIVPGQAALDAEEWSISARFSKPLIDRLSANWVVGLTRTDYSVEGTFPFTEVDATVFPIDVTVVNVPYATPDAETGYLWGVGFGWQTTANTALELNYRQHKTDVIDIDTTSLRMRYSF